MAASDPPPTPEEHVADGPDWRAPKDDRLVPYGDTNLGTPLELVDDAVVPTDLFFVRSNYRDPDGRPGDAGACACTAWSSGRSSSASPTSGRMPQRTVVGFLECSGNSRTRFEPATPGTPWQRRRRRQRDLDRRPARATCSSWPGRVPEAIEMVSQGADDPLMRRGLPMRAALDPDTLLALQMNGEDLLAAHGAPARLFVPGWGGIASTKWVTDLELAAERWDGLWNAVEYVLLDAYGRETGRVEEMPVKSVITTPAAGVEIAGRPRRR